MKFATFGLTCTLLAGCRGECLADELPTLQVASDRTEHVAGLIEAFAEWTAPNRVCISRVEEVAGLTVQRETLEGVYNRTTRGIRFDPSVGDADDTLRHELCHALYFQNDIADDPEWALDADYYGDASENAPERFAIWCALGAPTLALSTTPAADALFAEAFPGFDRDTLQHSPTGFQEWVAPADRMLLAPPVSSGLDVMAIASFGDDVSLGFTLVQLSLLDGEPTSGSEASDLVLGPAIPAPWTLGAIVDDPVWGLLATAKLNLLPSGASDSEWVVERDGVWVPILAGEARSDRAVLPGAEVSWAASVVDGQAVEWWPWTP